jgi:hypothetical protein
LSDASLGPGGELREDFFQVGANGDLEPQASGDHGDDRGDALAGFFPADMQPVLAAQSHGANGVLGPIVVDLHLAISDEGLP